MRRWLWFNGLSLVMFGAFLIFLTLQSVFGWQVHNEELVENSRRAIGYWSYLGTGHFGEAVFENWESEFLQMGSYVLLTAFLVQRGSPESKPVDHREGKGEAPRRKDFLSWLYSNSLSMALLGFFALAFLLHLFAGMAEHNEEQALAQGAAPISAWQFLGTPDFWFQSMQNWQSEFLAVGCLVVLSIFLRQHGSPQSKPVNGRSEES